MAFRSGDDKQVKYANVSVTDAAWAHWTGPETARGAVFQAIDADIYVSDEEDGDVFTIFSRSQHPAMNGLPVANTRFYFKSLSGSGTIQVAYVVGAIG